MGNRERLRFSVEGNCETIEKSNLSENHAPRRVIPLQEKSDLRVPFEHTSGIVSTLGDAEFRWKKLNCYIRKSDFPVSATNLYRQFSGGIWRNANVLGNPGRREYMIGTRVNESLDILAT